MGFVSPLCQSLHMYGLYMHDTCCTVCWAKAIQSLYLDGARWRRFGNAAGVLWLPAVAQLGCFPGYWCGLVMWLVIGLLPSWCCRPCLVYCRTEHVHMCAAQDMRTCVHVLVWRYTMFVTVLVVCCHEF
jgi:hypothetical protein